MLMEKLMQQAEQVAKQHSQRQLAELARLPSTEEIRAELTRPPKYAIYRDHPERQPAYYESIRKQLALAEQRDTIQITRPAGCWCLGSGERRQAYATTASGDKYLSGNEYCTCPEGQEARARYDAEVAEQLSDDIREKEEASEIPRRFADFTLATSPVKKLAKKLALADPNQSFFLWGAFGTGKTGLAVGYAWAWIEKTKGKRTVLFRTLPNMLSELRATYNPHPEETETEQNLLDQYQHVGLLILDDIGAEQISAKGPAWMQDRLYQIIGNRHDEMRPMIFTSNLALDELEKRLGERLTWRILEMCGKENIIEVKGPNLRDF